eukprot:c28705_g1_i1 orf=723-2438(-)
MADVVDSVLAETTSNGKPIDTLEEEKGTMKSFTAEEENGKEEQRTELEDEKPSADGEDYSETLDSKQEHDHKKGSEEPKEKKASGESRGKTKTAPVVDKSEGKASEKRKRLKKEPATPSPSLFIDRPTRERKSIDRFVASIEKEKVRELKIEKGAGTLLKDIPNVAYMVSRRTKSDDSLQLLHKLLYGKRMKPPQVKQNILQFSGYVWGLDQEKEKGRVKERLEKCHKDSLVQVCELLDLIISKSGKKEDIVAKLLEFLESPHKTRDLLIEENLKGKKGKKRSRKSQKGGKGTPAQTPQKKRKSGGTPKVEKRVEAEDDKVDDWDEDEDEDDENEEETGKRKRSREESDDEEYNVKAKKSKKKGKKSSKKAVAQEIDAKETTSEESSEDEAEKVKTPVKVSIKSPSKSGKSLAQSSGKGVTKDETPSSKVFSRKKKQDEQEQVAKETSLKEKLTKGKALNKSATKEIEKPKKGAKKFDPSDEELRAAICNLLEEADFSKDTFADVIKKLEKKFNFDLSQKKAHVKILIQEEISKIAEEDDGEEDEEENADEEWEGEKEESDPGDVADQAEG